MTFLLQTFITEYAWHFISVKLKISSFIYHQMQLWNTEFLTIRSRCLFEMFPSFAIWKVICISTWFFNYKFFFIGLWLLWAPLVAQRIKNLSLTQETWVQSLGGEKSPGEGNGYPLKCSCLENSMDRGAWQATLHGVTKNWTRLSD